MYSFLLIICPLFPCWNSNLQLTSTFNSGSGTQSAPYGFVKEDSTCCGEEKMRGAVYFTLSLSLSLFSGC